MTDPPNSFVPQIPHPRLVSVNMDYSPDDQVEQHENGVPEELDMDIMHDFGEGVGLDMRDFALHEGLEAEIEAAKEENDITPTLPQGGLMPNPPTSATTNGGSGSVSGAEHPSSTGVDMDDMFQAETGLDGDDEDDDGDETGDNPAPKRPRNNDVPGGFTFVDKDGEPGRRKIRIEYIADKSRRHITFSKRKAGIMKKAYELSILTGTQVLLLVVSETGLVYTFTTTKLQPLVQKAEGKNLIQACLNAPDGFGPDGQPLTGPVPATKSKNGGLAIRPHKLTPAASAAMAASAQAASQAGPSDDHSQSQAEAVSSLGHGTPMSQRPKKRLPSGKGKKANSAGSGTAKSEMPLQQPDIIPPVPQIPDMHRQPSPHSGMLGNLASPMSAGYHHIPPEYHQHHHQPSPTSQSFGYSPQQGGPPTGQEYVQQQQYYSQGQPHPGYLNMQQQQQAQMQYQAEQRERARMMIEGQSRNMGMGM